MASTPKQTRYHFFTLSDNRSYDHDSCRCHGTPNQQTCIRPPRTCCHLPCPTTSGLWRIQCLPMQPICWRPAANRLIFMRDGLCPLCSIFSDLLPCIGCMLFDYGWYGIRRATNSKCIHVAIVLVDCIELTSNKMILLLIITQEEKQGGVDALKDTTQQSNDRGLKYATIEGGGRSIMSFGGVGNNKLFTFSSHSGELELLATAV